MGRFRLGLRFVAKAANHLIKQRRQRFVLGKRVALVDFDMDLVAADLWDCCLVQGDDDGAAQLLKAFGTFVVCLAETNVEQALR